MKVLLSLLMFCYLEARVCEDIKIRDNTIFVKMTDITETEYNFKYKFSKIKDSLVIIKRDNKVLEITSFNLPCIIGNNEDINEVIINLK